MSPSRSFLSPPRATLRAAAPLAVAIAFFFAACGKESPLARRPALPVIVISIDTLRADHLPVFGYDKVSTPNIDALAKDAIVFDNAYSHVPLTFPSHVSMLTGTLPAETAVRNNLGYRFDSAKHPSIPTLLKAKGYSTAAAVSAYVLRGATGLAEAFDSYDDRIGTVSGGSVGVLQRQGYETVEVAARWVEEKKDNPLFLFVHVFEPHAPYEPREPFKTQYADRPYDGEIAVSDADVGKLIESLKRNGVYDDATIILMSDHGEGLGDHGEEQHGIFLYREAIHVPLLVKLPDAELSGTRVKTPVQLLDILPTIAEVVGFDVPANVKGTSLVKIAKGETPDRRIFSETMYPRIHLGWSDLASLIDATHHFIEAPKPELYDLAADPSEKANVLADQRRVFAAMRKEMEGHDRRLEVSTNVDPEEAAKLAALGYLGSVSSAANASDLPDPKDGIHDMNGVTKAAALAQRGQLAESAKLLREVLVRNPAFADGWTQLGKTLEMQGRFEEALDAYKKTIEAAPMLAPGTALSMADVYLRLNRWDDCVKHAELAVEVHPGAARLTIARAYLAKRDLVATERAARKVIEDPSRKRDGLILMAQVRTFQRRFPEAASLLDSVKAETSALGQQPLATYNFARGDLHARMGQLVDAKQSFEEEIRYFPQNREAYVRLAVLLTLEGREDDANKTFEAMVKANPSRSSYALAADTFRDLRRPGSAKSWAVRARTTG
ncbi:MAG: sulfatase-like hydrolase/transferase [Acidobacteria bacterium]|nr:sulfatase-like hydrolase/transferase [Acidobacteriota bacterium]